ncbi:hypothetical protein EJV47_16565 [Hymenobacter gummosus]|uniref:Uncharacterized protein n=1 Tax=Hymenobacter gummosus TaxID=1776032 RepID=A0A3S0H5F7_9BACT|nr:hypothetical protein [Hymenobacter gummosus]RTQ48585.1 hypothetical protein EJV47_16565 [Hymenobacter gummosus]
MSSIYQQFVRLSCLLAAVGGTCAACQSSADEAGKQGRARPDTARVAPAPPAVRPPATPPGPDTVEVAPEEVSFYAYFRHATGQPLSVAALVQQGARIISRRPTVNHHDETQVDTLVELAHGPNRFTLYRAPGKDLLTAGYLTDFAPPYARRLASRVRAAREQAKPTCCPNGLRLFDAEEGMESILVTFAADSIKSIKLEPYWD